MSNEALQIGDLVRIPANSQLIEYDRAPNETLRGYAETPNYRTGTTEPQLGLVFEVATSPAPRPSYVGVVVDGIRWLVDDKYVSKAQ